MLMCVREGGGPWERETEGVTREGARREEGAFIPFSVVAAGWVMRWREGVPLL